MMYAPAKNKVRAQLQLDWLVTGLARVKSLEKTIAELLTPNGIRAYADISAFGAAHGMGVLPQGTILRALSGYHRCNADRIHLCDNRSVAMPADAVAYATECERRLERTCLLLALSLTVSPLLSVTGRTDELLDLLASVSNCGSGTQSRADQRSQRFRNWALSSRLFSFAWVSNAMSGAVYLPQPLERQQRVRMARILNQAAWIVPPETCGTVRLALASAAYSCRNFVMIRRAISVAPKNYRDVLQEYVETRR